MSVVGRYAPSPTGSLHLGNLRTALVAWLSARSQSGRCCLRIDDLDPQRSREHWVEEQLADLAALGLDWAGEPIRQSKRSAAYSDALAQLERAGLVYECFCTRAEIREAPSAPHGELPEGAYPGTCRELSAAQRAERHDSGRPAALRVRAGATRIDFKDRLAGLSGGLVDDFVVRRNDGVAAYNLATVVDDAFQRVTEVVRGADLLASTPRQIWLAQRLGLTPPAWMHVPLVLGPDGTRLAKRHGAVTLGDRRSAGHAQQELLVELAGSIGVPPGPGPERLVDMAARFKLGRVPLGPVVLDAGGAEARGG